MSNEIPNFQDILNMPAVDIKDPVALPTGSYLCLITHPQPTFDKAGPNNTDCVDFTLAPQQAQEDVDQHQLAQALNGAALNTKTIKHRMFVTPDSAHRLKRFLADDLGIKVTTLKEMIPEAMGKEVFAKLVHQPSKDQKTVFVNVNKTWHV
jgi:hypothetical protein